MLLTPDTIDSPLFTTAEAQLLQSLASANAAPYIAHHDVPDTLSLTAQVSTAVRGDFRRLVKLFRFYPAVSLWTIGNCLATRYQEEGGHAYYPLLASAFGFDGDWSPQERQHLRDMVRRAAQRLGLVLAIEDERIGPIHGEFLSPQSADDFFLQAGVAISQASHLASCFNRASGALGAPNVDDSTTALIEWEREALMRYCPNGLKRMPKAVLLGSNGYHAALYARLVSGELPSSAFEKALMQAHETLPPPRSEFNPRLVFEDGDLFVYDTNETGPFTVTLRSGDVAVRGASGVRVPAPWPDSIICRSSSSTTERVVEILGSHSRLLVFDEPTGRLLSRLSGSVDAVVVASSEVVLVAGEPFTVDEVEAYPRGSGAHVLYRDLRSEQTVVCGDLGTRLRPRPRPMLRVVGETSVIGRFRSVPFYASVTAIEIQDLTIAGEDGASALELRVSHPAMDTTTVTCPELGSDGAQRVDLATVLPASGDFGLLKLELTLRDSERVLQRATCWYWPGLTRFDNGKTFVARAVPDNLDEGRSERLRLVDGRVELDQPDPVPYIRAVLRFKRRDDGEGRQPPLAEFLFPPPGVSMTLREGNGQERPLRMGQSLALAPDDTGVVIIRSPNPDARLEVNGRREDVSFDRSGTRSLSAAVLAGEEAGPEATGEIRIQQPNRPGVWRPLIRLADVATATHFALTAGSDSDFVSVALPRAPKRVRVCGTGLLHEVDFEQLMPDSSITVTQDGDNTISCEMRRHVVPRADVYLTHIEVDLGDGRWRRLTNKRRDSFDWVMDVGHASAMASNVLDRQALLMRLSSVMSACAALPCWPSIRDTVLPLWSTIVAEHATSSVDDAAALLKVSMKPWDQGASPTWIPIVHPLEVAPEILGAPSAAFERIDADELAPGFDHVQAIGTIASAPSVMKACEQLRVLPQFPGAFENVAKVSRGHAEDLEGFQFTRYALVMHGLPSADRESLWTPRKERLTPEHHAWCCQQYAERLQVVYIGANNAERVRDLAKLCRAAWATAQQLHGKQREFLNPPVRLLQSYSDEDRVLFENAPTVLSLFAKHSRQATTRQLLSALKAHTSTDSVSLLRSISLMIRLAPELFGFYLLLWELATMGER